MHLYILILVFKFTFLLFNILRFAYRYKKKRLKKEEQERKLSHVMKEFLVQKSSLDESSSSTLTAIPLDLLNENQVPVPPQSFPEEVQILKEILSDPELWNSFCISSQTRQILVERGPHQIKEFEFPINKGRRRFSPSHYLKVLNNGEVVERSYLLYYN
ncbi:hypothetical protein RN001_005523 [Aquatica leii]|uniref:Uncharacterized protein n=1 Tax=Aquatica leii TaxID=1421715 RepID=A0AAN7PCI5_9COLE|nr:hypothetical protein RN001_005523 [Aquatica leii]